MDSLAYAPNWDNSVTWASQGNGERHKTYRQFFQNQEENVVSQLPRAPAVRKLVKQTVAKTITDRDPTFRDPLSESGWDDRSCVVAAKDSVLKHTYRSDRRFKTDLFNHTRPAPPAAGFDGKFLRKNERVPATPFIAGVGSAEGGVPATAPVMSRRPRTRDMTSTELRERAVGDEYHSYWRTNESNPRRQLTQNRKAQTARSYGERRLPKPKQKKGDWDTRFQVMVSKDNRRNHSSYREYFDAPRHFVHS